MKPAHGSLEQAFVGLHIPRLCPHSLSTAQGVSNNGEAPQGTGIVHMAW